MNKRIEKLEKLTLDGKMLVEPIKTNFDRMDLFLDSQERDVKRICEYVLNQQPLITKYSRFTGLFRFDGSVIGDVFSRAGHKNTNELIKDFYCKSIDNLSSMDWQHGTSDYRKVLSVGIVGIISDIDKSISQHSEQNKIDFLKGLKKIAETFILWIKKCAALVSEYSKSIEEPDYRKNLEKLSCALLSISENAPKNFYEAVLTIYVCLSMNPDSFGTLDRYLSDFYFNDISDGTLTREDAKAYLQELFLMVQAYTPKDGYAFTRGGQSHFCVGGRDENGRDCYNQVSQLIIESLMELDTHIPEVSLRWTNDTPREVFKYILECEKNDKNKRIAFTNDDRRIEAYTKICGLPYKEAINYTLVGCNEPALLGGMCASTSHANLAHSIEYVMHCRSKETAEAKTFEDFYEIFKDQLYKDLDKIYYYDDLYNLQRAKDINYVSCLFLNGCIENGKSITQGGVNYAISNIMFLGNVTVIDSLAIIKQFVFDEKSVTMWELIDALKNNWVGYENLKMSISKRGKFFGNDDDTSNYAAKLLYDTLFKYIKNKKTVFGYPALIGDHTGYQLHFKWFGEGTKATPDGRYNGEPLSYGISQNNGKLKNGLTALMNSISKFDTNGISSATVTNFTLDKLFVENENYFDKTVDMLETYFKNGGIQFQLNYMSQEELLAAKATPEKYKNLKVRVTGYSDYFTNLNEAIQDSIIKRYEER
ncbi:MAG: hypothetical protein KIG65_07965 [Eubacteriales bacterium]|nr:hypothetical protein [Eubacteriales bacterium]